MSSKGRLSVVDGPSKGATLELGWQRAYTIGRGRDNDLQVKDRNISREHCRVEYDGDYFWLVDNDSANGTFVNDEQVHRYMLYDDDHIRIGQSTIRIQLIEAEQ